MTVLEFAKWDINKTFSDVLGTIKGQRVGTRWESDGNKETIPTSNTVPARDNA